MGRRKRGSVHKHLQDFGPMEPSDVRRIKVARLADTALRLNGDSAGRAIAWLERDFDRAFAAGLERTQATGKPFRIKRGGRIVEEAVAYLRAGKHLK